MSQKEKLIELLSGINVLDYSTANFTECIADYLLANGIIVLPCKVGDTVYTNVSMQGWYMRMKARPYKAKIAFIGINGTDNFINVTFENGNMLQFKFSDFGKTVFLTREEAEKALAERNKSNDKK